MIVFRILQKISVINAIKNQWLQYIVTVMIVIVGTIIFSYILKNTINFLVMYLQERTGKER